MKVVLDRVCHWSPVFHIVKHRSMFPAVVRNFRYKRWYNHDKLRGEIVCGEKSWTPVKVKCVVQGVPKDTQRKQQSHDTLKDEGVSCGSLSTAVLKICSFEYIHCLLRGNSSQ